MDKVSVVKTEYRMKQWIERIKECRSSGMTSKKWCETNGINIKTYSNWLHKLREKVNDETEIQAIVPLQIRPRETAAAITVSIGSISIKIADGTSPETITTVLDVCKRIC
jgi:putative transposase